MKKKGIDMILLTILLSYFIILLDNSVIFTSTIQISKSLGLSPIQLSWVSTAYSLTFGGFLLLGGKAGDIFGRKKVFITGLTVFGIGSFLVGCSLNFPMIIIARSIEGIGAAILSPATLALIMDTYEREDRKKAIAYYGATAGIGTSLGLVIGGAMTSLVSWRLGFFTNVPVVGLLIFFASKYLKDTGKTQGQIDYVGSILSVTAMFSLIYGIVTTSNNILFISIGVVLFVIFLIFENTAQNPIVPLHIFNNKVRNGALLSRFFFFASMIACWFFTPQYLQNELGFSPFLAGVSFFPLTVASFMVALQIPKLTKKYSETFLLKFGFIVALFSMSIMPFISVNNYYVKLMIPMIILGIGQGIILSLLTLFGVYQAKPEDTGTASGLLNAVQQIGGAFGLAIVVTVIPKGMSPDITYNNAIICTSLLMLIAVISAMLLIKIDKKKEV